jgi:hypothetical protein
LFRGKKGLVAARAYLSRHPQRARLLRLGSIGRGSAQITTVATGRLHLRKFLKKRASVVGHADRGVAKSYLQERRKLGFRGRGRRRGYHGRFA